jgi:protein pelota
MIFKDLKQGEIKLVAENLDDIWHLYNLIEPDDLIRAVTYRTDEQKTDKIRSKKAEKKRMKLGIRVEKICFHEFSDRLRIHGVIEEGPQELGSYHTYNVDAEKMDAFSIIKDKWHPHHLDRIEEAVKQRQQPFLLFVSLDDDAATIAILRQSGVQQLASIESHRSGKMYDSTSTEKQYFTEIVTMLKSVQTSQTPLIVIGPGFTREHFVTFGRYYVPDLFSDVRSLSTGNAGMNGVQETLKSGMVDQITKENRVVKETQFVEKIFKEIQKNGLVTYGYAQVTEALEKGAVEYLLIIDTMVRTKEGESLLQLTRTTRSDFIIINSLHEAGKKFEGLGGVAALLRFKI